MRKFFVSAIVFSCCLSGLAQQEETRHSYWRFLAPSESGRMDAGFTVGTTGLGLDVNLPYNEWVDFRAGFSIMPQVRMKARFGVQVGEEATVKTYDEAGNRTDKLGRMSAMLESFTGFSVDDAVDMYCVPTYHNFKFIADVKPFADKRWRFSVGFYWGNSVIGRSYNVTEAMPSLLAVGMYNRIYDAVINEDPVVSYQNGDININFEFTPQINEKIKSTGRMGVGIGRWKHDQYYTEEVPYIDEDGEEQVHHIGDVKNPAGSVYLMEPGSDGMVKAKMVANRFKPYLGFGFHDKLDKEGLWQWSVDAGVLFWGGVPHVYTHEGVCLTHDVEDIPGKPGRYMNVVNQFPVFPMLELRLSRKVF